VKEEQKAKKVTTTLLEKQLRHDMIIPEDGGQAAWVCACQQG